MQVQTYFKLKIKIPNTFKMLIVLYKNTVFKKFKKVSLRDSDVHFAGWAVVSRPLFLNNQKQPTNN